MNKLAIHSRHSLRKLVRRRSSLQLTLLLTSLALLATGCSNLATNQSVVVDQSTPEKAVENLYKAFNTSDRALFYALIDPDDPDRDRLVKGFDELMASGIVYEHSDLKLDTVEATSDMTRVRVHFHEKILADGRLLNDEESGAELTLVTRNGMWYFTGLAQWPPPGWIVEDTPVPYATPTAPSSGG